MRTRRREGKHQREKDGRKGCTGIKKDEFKSTWETPETGPSEGSTPLSIKYFTEV